LAGGPVFLAVEELPDLFETPESAEQAVPELYGTGLYELIWRDGWRVSMRYWRPAPPAPVARTGASAAKKPLGHARTPEDARKLLGAPAELASEVLPTLYVDHKTAHETLGRSCREERARRDCRARRQVRDRHLPIWRPIHAPGIAAPLAPIERIELAGARRCTHCKRTNTASRSRYRLVRRASDGKSKRRARHRRRRRAVSGQRVGGVIVPALSNNRQRIGLQRR
jgi:hypothetical protein